VSSVAADGSSLLDQLRLSAKEPIVISIPDLIIHNMVANSSVQNPVFACIPFVRDVTTNNNFFHNFSFDFLICDVLLSSIDFFTTRE
jgi:hypothetical protein